MYPDRYEYGLTQLRYTCKYTRLDGEIYSLYIIPFDDTPLNRNDIIKRFLSCYEKELENESQEYLEPQYFEIETITPNHNSPIYKVIFSDPYDIVWAYCHADSVEEAIEIFESGKEFVAESPKDAKIIKVYKTKKNMHSAEEREQ